MLPRHFVVLFFAAVISLACYQVAARNRLANLITHATDLIVSEGLYEVDQDQLLVSAMDGMLNQLDQNSSFLYGTAADDRDEYLNQSYAGLGIHIRRDPATKYILVKMPMFGSPAREAGLQAGDLIAKIDQQAVDQIESMDEVRDLLKGPEGSTVDLEILRGDPVGHAALEPSSANPLPGEPGGTGQILNVSVQRRTIPTPSVVGDRPNDQGAWHFFLENDPKIGYIRITQFGSRTAEEVSTALKSIEGQVDSLILDMRENPGGLLEAAVQISDLFIDQPGQTILSIKDRSGNVMQEYVSTSGKILANNLPIVVLVNQNSASASEIVAACLQDYNIARIAGQKSYGKGTVQTQFALPRPRTYLNLTTATYWRPSGRNIHRMKFRSPSISQTSSSSNAGSATGDKPSQVSEEWGVTPDPELEVILNLRDSAMLSLMYNNRQLGIAADDVDDGLKEALDRLGWPASNTNGADNNAAEPLTMAPAPPTQEQGIVRIEQAIMAQQTPPIDSPAVLESDPTEEVIDIAVESPLSGGTPQSDTILRVPNQLTWDQDQTLHQRDPQLARVIAFLKNKMLQE